MGIQDRDYYREWWNEREGKSKKPKRLRLRMPSVQWHWSLQLIATLVLCTVVFAVLKGLSKLLT